jgi:hypothetical protein
MKKTLLATLVAGLIPMIVAAQGTVNFSSTALAHEVVLEGTTTPAGTGFVAALYWAPAGSAESALIQLGGTVPVTAGYLNSPAVRTTGAGTAEGVSALFQVRAWNGGFATYEAALAAATGLVGKGGGGGGGLNENMFNNPTGAPNGTPPSVPASLSGWTTPIQVHPVVPEPSTGRECKVLLSEKG